MSIDSLVGALQSSHPEMFKPRPKYTPFPSPDGVASKFQMINHDPRWLGITSTYSPFSLKVSSSRNAMVTNQKGQIVVCKGAETPRILHGFESQEAQYCFGAKAPCDMYILNIIKCRQASNTVLTTIVFEDIETGMLDCLDIVQYERYHDTFGFELFMTEEARHLGPGDTVTKGTILSKTNSVKDGIYGPGVNAQCAYMADASSIEDGFAVSKSLLAKLTPKATGSRAADYGSDWYPLNLYGTKEFFKPYPDVGEKVRQDGLLMAYRKRDPLMDCVNMTPAALMEIDMDNDKLFYVDAGAINAKVYRIDVIDSENEGARQSLPPEMSNQVKTYGRQWTQYHAQIVHFYNQYQSERKVRGIHKLNASPRILKKVVDALVDKPNDVERIMGNGRNFPVRGKAKQGRITRTYRGDTLNEFRVEIHFEYDFDIWDSAKLTDYYGGKGVICRVMEDEDMPTYSDGTRADVIIYFRSGVARLNPGQFVEQYITANMRCASKTLVSMVDAGVANSSIYRFIEDYYEVLSPDMASIFRFLPAELKDQQVKAIYDNGFYITSLTASDSIDVETLRDKLEACQKTQYEPVTYRNLAGIVTTTDVPVLIGSKYMVILDKSDPKPMSTSVGPIQHHSLPAIPNRATRHSTPTKEQPPRAWGETEMQVNSGVVSGDALAEVASIATNPGSTTLATYAISEAENPSDIESVTDHVNNPPGSSSPQRFVTNLFESFGVTLTKD